jgi:hypothetical protein
VQRRASRLQSKQKCHKTTAVLCAELRDVVPGYKPHLLKYLAHATDLQQVANIQ